MNRILSLIGVVLVVGCGPEPRDLETLQELDGVYTNPEDGQPEPRNIETLQLLYGVYMNPEDGQPYSGPVFEYYGTRDLFRRTGSLKDGVEDGLWENYYLINLMGRTTYKDGELDGPYERFNYQDMYSPSQLMVKGTWKDGEKCGQWFEEGETVMYPPC